MIGRALARAWWRPRPGPLARCLWPVGRLVAAVAEVRMARPPRARLAIPVLCVGNPTVGGAGKTPTALWLAAHLEGRGLRPAFLTRGYGGRCAGPLVVDPARHTAREVGDEALVLAEAAPVVVARDRAAGGRLAAGLGVDAVVMDDGFQNPGLSKDLSLLVVDGAVLLGNGLPVPSGPMRARLAPQLARADAVVVMGGEAGARPGILAGFGGPVVAMALVPRPAPALAGRRVLAFAGIGRPEKLAESCRAAGAVVAAFSAFPDHHPYTEAVARALLARAVGEGLVPVTTTKDAARLAGHAGARGALAGASHVLVVDAVPLGPEAAALTALVDATLEGSRPPAPG